jgi:hypothetical protein
MDGSSNLLLPGGPAVELAGMIAEARRYTGRMRDTLPPAGYDGRPPKPFPRSYWVVPGRLLGGYYPGERDLDDAEAKLLPLLASGLRTFVNLMEADETGWDGQPFTPYERRLVELGAERGIEVDCWRFPIRDVTAPPRETAVLILDAIDASLYARRPVYVHCRGGIGRTGAIVGCCLVRHGLATGGDVIDRIRDLRRAHPEARRREFPQCLEQREIVTTWTEGS